MNIKNLFLIIIALVGFHGGLYALENYYDILGIGPAATEKEISTAYKKLALKWHPDKNKTPEAQEMFTKIQEAYEVLSNPKRRQFYDRDLAYGQVVIETNQKATNSDFNFEIMNKTVDPLFVTVRNGGETFVRLAEVNASSSAGAGYLRISGLNLYAPTYISIWAGAQKPDKTTPPTAEYKTTGDGKTIFFSWDKGNLLRPGLTSNKGKTSSGLSLRNNIAVEDIQKREK